MPPSRDPLWLAALAIVLLTVATGPSLGLIEVPDAGHADLGTGFADVEIRSVPTEARLVPDRYADVHELEVPAVRADIAAVSGSPIVTLSLDIEDLGFQRSSVYTLGEGAVGTRTFIVRPTTIESDRLAAEEYPGRLRLVLRESAGTSVLVEEQVRISVDP